MATYTPNLNLYKPDSSDDFGDFREAFNDNMDILDQGGGGGGDSVSYTQTLATGEKVGEITINGTAQDINAPKYKIAVKTNLVGVKYLELSSPDSGDSSTVLASAINPSITWYQNALLIDSGDFIGSLGVDNVSTPIYARSYIGGDGVEVNQLQTGEGQISLEYLKVVDGAVNLVFDDGN